MTPLEVAALVLAGWLAIALLLAITVGRCMHAMLNPPAPAREDRIHVALRELGDEADRHWTA
jgi:hypothetical protein